MTVKTGTLDMNSIDFFFSLEERDITLLDKYLDLNTLFNQNENCQYQNILSLEKKTFNSGSS